MSSPACWVLGLRPDGRAKSGGGKGVTWRAGLECNCRKSRVAADARSLTGLTSFSRAAASSARTRPHSFSISLMLARSCCKQPEEKMISCLSFVRRNTRLNSHLCSSFELYFFQKISANFMGCLTSEVSLYLHIYLSVCLSSTLKRECTNPWVRINIIKTQESTLCPSPGFWSVVVRGLVAAYWLPSNSILLGISHPSCADTHPQKHSFKVDKKISFLIVFLSLFFFFKWISRLGNRCNYIGKSTFN